MTDEQKEDAIREAVFRNIANGTDPHGSFLTLFAQCYIRADLDNQAILKDAAKTLITKYDLEEEQVKYGILKPEQYSE